MRRPPSSPWGNSERSGAVCAGRAPRHRLLRLRAQLEDPTLGLPAADPGRSVLRHERPRPRAPRRASPRGSCPLARGQSRGTMQGVLRLTTPRRTSAHLSPMHGRRERGCHRLAHALRRRIAAGGPAAPVFEYSADFSRRDWHAPRLHAVLPSQVDVAHLTRNSGLRPTQVDVRRGPTCPYLGSRDGYRKELAHTAADSVCSADAPSVLRLRAQRQDPALGLPGPDSGRGLLRHRRPRPRAPRHPAPRSPCRPPRRQPRCAMRGVHRLTTPRRTSDTARHHLHDDPGPGFPARSRIPRPDRGGRRVASVPSTRRNRPEGTGTHLGGISRPLPDISAPGAPSFRAHPL